MDQLNAQQIVLLTLLVSFVTSIATGITTVSLLEQAPEPVTQTINRIVEKTVERVVTEPTEEDPEPVEKEVVTVVVNEEDRTIEAVEKNAKSLMRIYSKGSAGEKTFVAIGIVVSADGDVVTDASLISASANYVGVYSSGEFDLDFADDASQVRFAKLSIAQPAEGETAPTGFSAADFGNSEALKLAQSVISISGQTQNTVSSGIINSIDKNESGNFLINTSVSAANVLTGSIIVNLSGEIIGFKTSNFLNGPTSFIPANVLKEFLSNTTATDTTNETETNLSA